MLTQEFLKRASILIVDDQMTNIMLLESMLKTTGYTNIHSTTNSSEVIDLFEKLNPDLICLDIHMPHLNGFQVMEQLKAINKQTYLPILVLTSDADRETRIRALESGGKDFLNKPFDNLEVLMRIQNILEASLLHKEIKHQNDCLEEIVKARTSELEETKLEIVYRLARAAEYRDDDTGAHILRMSHYCAILGKALGMNDEEIELLRNAMPLHDIGKIGIPDRILLKPGKLNPEEWEIMKTHTLIGGALLCGSGSTLLQMAETIAITHHEKWDGTGYPNKLVGEDIPLPGRICAICDIFDALMSERPYKNAWPLEETMDEIRNLRGSHLDPYLVDLFEERLTSIVEIQTLFVDTPLQNALDPVTC